VFFGIQLMMMINPKYLNLNLLGHAEKREVEAAGCTDVLQDVNLRVFSGVNLKNMAFI